MNATIEQDRGLSDFWSVPAEELLRRLGSSHQGIPSVEARQELSGSPTE